MRALGRWPAGSVYELAQRAAKRPLCPKKDFYTLRIYSAACEWMVVAGYVEHRPALRRLEIRLTSAGERKAFEFGLISRRPSKAVPARTPVIAGVGALALAGCAALGPASSADPTSRSIEAYSPTPIAAAKVVQISAKTTGAYWSYCEGDCPRPTPKTLTTVAAPAPTPAVAEQRIQKLQLSADVLFAFDSFQLTDKGRAELDRLAAKLNGSSSSKTASTVVVGYTDRLGSDVYNRRLSERRAEAVKEYLGPLANAKSILSQGLGRADSVTGRSCDSIKESRKLRDCLQPDRRVEITVANEG